MKITSLLILCLFFLKGNAQQSDNYYWWNVKHGYNGQGPWNSLFNYSPAYFGPNALPVPELRETRPDTVLALENRVEYHGRKGDLTINALTKLQVPVVKRKVSLLGWVVPQEYFEVDSVIRDQRKMRNKQGKGFAGGDIYVSTLVQLTEQQKRFFDSKLEICLRTASGTNMHSARYTDAPGYYFALHAGKTIYRFTSGSIYFKGMAGFYAWQTADVNHSQNDAYLYGASIEYATKRLLWSSSLRGYSGYMKNGDQPLVWRNDINLQLNKSLRMLLSHQEGLRDFPFTTISFGLTYIPFAD